MNMEDFLRSKLKNRSFDVDEDHARAAIAMLRKEKRRKLAWWIWGASLAAAVIFSVGLFMILRPSFSANLDMVAEQKISQDIVSKVHESDSEAQNDKIQLSNNQELVIDLPNDYPVALQPGEKIIVDPQPARKSTELSRVKNSFLQETTLNVPNQGLVQGTNENEAKRGNLSLKKGTSKIDAIPTAPIANNVQTMTALDISVIAHNPDGFISVINIQQIEPLTIQYLPLGLQADEFIALNMDESRLIYNSNRKFFSKRPVFEMWGGLQANQHRMIALLAGVGLEYPIATRWSLGANIGFMRSALMIEEEESVFYDFDINGRLMQTATIVTKPEIAHWITSRIEVNHIFKKWTLGTGIRMDHLLGLIALQTTSALDRNSTSMGLTPNMNGSVNVSSMRVDLENDAFRSLQFYNYAVLTYSISPRLRVSSGLHYRHRPNLLNAIEPKIDRESKWAGELLISWTW